MNPNPYELAYQIMKCVCIVVVIIYAFRVGRIIHDMMLYY